MTDKPIDLDQHRGISAQKATGLRRLLAEVDSMKGRCGCGKMNWNAAALGAGGELA